MMQTCAPRMNPPDGGPRDASPTAWSGYLAAALVAGVCLLGPIALAPVARLAAGLIAATVLLIGPGHVVRRCLGLSVGDRVGGVVADLALSVTVLVLLGLFLDRLPWGLTEETWRIGLGSAAGLAAAYLWLRVGPARLPALSGSLPRLNLPLACCLIAAVMAGGSYAYARHGAISAQEATAFTQLWVQPRADNRMINVGLVNHEGRESRYAVIMTTDGVVRQTLHVAVASGASWQTTVDPRTVELTKGKLTVSLRIDQDAAIYREVWLTWPTPT